MGNLCSSTKTSGDGKKAEARQYQTTAAESLKPTDAKEQSRKIGLSGTHQAVKLLGRGAAADIWLFRDLKHGNQVAVKLFERPLAQGAVQAVLREIKVCSWPLLPRAAVYSHPQTCNHGLLQIQTEIGEGHVNLINVYQLILTPTHLALCMEWASGGSLTSYVADKWQHANPNGLVLSEDEARYFFKVSITPCATAALPDQLASCSQSPKSWACLEVMCLPDK